MSIFASLVSEEPSVLVSTAEQDRRQRPDRRETWRGGRRVTDFSCRRRGASPVRDAGREEDGIEPAIECLGKEAIPREVPCARRLD